MKPELKKLINEIRDKSLREKVTEFVVNPTIDALS